MQADRTDSYRVEPMFVNLIGRSYASNKPKRKKRLRYLILLSLGIFLLLLYLKIISVVMGECMSPTINPLDIIIVNPFSKDINRCDMVTINAPKWTKGLRVYVKRIIGVSGDSIYWESPNRININGKILNVDIDNAKKHGISIPDFPKRIPEGYVFVAGDNEKRSFDSRYIGLIPKNNIRGKVLIIIPTGSRD